MSTMNISLPEPLKQFVDERVSKSGYGTSSEYVRDLIRRDQDRIRLREILVAGGASPASGEANSEYFSGLREIARQKLEAG